MYQAYARRLKIVVSFGTEEYSAIILLGTEEYTKTKECTLFSCSDMTLMSL
jgi:hypothetical protein